MKKTAFENFLGEDPQHFSDGSYVISAEKTKEEFVKIMKEYYYKNIDIDKISEDWVHFHWGEGDDGEKVNWWWLSSEGMRGAKKVWVY